MELFTTFMNHILNLKSEKLRIFALIVKLIKSKTIFNRNTKLDINYFDAFILHPFPKNCLLSHDNT